MQQNEGAVIAPGSGTSLYQGSEIWIHIFDQFPYFPDLWIFDENTSYWLFIVKKIRNIWAI